MSNEGKPKANGLLGALSGNVTAIVQAGALGLVALILVGGFKLTVDQVKTNREEALSFRIELEKQRLHDSGERERNRLIVEGIRADHARDHRVLMAELEGLRAQVRKLTKE